MMKKIFSMVLLAGLAFLGLQAQPSGFAPDATIKFADRDTCSLYFDYYAPSDGQAGKPTVIYIFGGGFKNGHRSQLSRLDWFKDLTDNGYGVISMDYRLGLKGKKFKKNLKFLAIMDDTLNAAVEDLFSLTTFLLAEGREIGVDPQNLVVAGSSAGAITALTAEWMICNGRPLASVLPEGFNYKGIMSFSGAIFATSGKLSYSTPPCPQLLFHGMSDKMVPYGRMPVPGTIFAGSRSIAKALSREDRNYRIYRIRDHYHEIASCEGRFINIEKDFLEENVSGGKAVVVDATVSDPSIPIPEWASGDTASLYE